MKIVKLSEEIIPANLYKRFLDEGKTPEQAAEQLLMIIAPEFDAIGEPQRGKLIQNVIGKYTIMPKRDMRNLPVRRVSIQCIAHPEWGTWGVMEDHGGYYDIQGDHGGRVLDKSEAEKFWKIV